MFKLFFYLFHAYVIYFVCYFRRDNEWPPTPALESDHPLPTLLVTLAKVTFLFDEIRVIFLRQY